MRLSPPAMPACADAPSSEVLIFQFRFDITVANGKFPSAQESPWRTDLQPLAH